MSTYYFKWIFIDKCYSYYSWSVFWLEIWKIHFCQRDGVCLWMMQYNTCFENCSFSVYTQLWNSWLFCQYTKKKKRRNFKIYFLGNVEVNKNYKSICLINRKALLWNHSNYVTDFQLTHFIFFFSISHVFNHQNEMSSYHYFNKSFVRPVSGLINCY